MEGLLSTGSTPSSFGLAPSRQHKRFDIQLNQFLVFKVILSCRASSQEVLHGQKVRPLIYVIKIICCDNTYAGIMLVCHMKLIINKLVAWVNDLLIL